MFLIALLSWRSAERSMKKLFKKIENWIWIVLLVAALIYFQSLVQSFQSENKELKESQEQFSQQIEEKYEKSKRFQLEIQAYLNEITQTVLEFLKVSKSCDPR